MLQSIYSQLAMVNTSPLAKVFHAGYVELARVLVPLGRIPEAAGMLRGAYEVYSRSIGPFHQATLEVAGMLRQLGG